MVGNPRDDLHRKVSSGLAELLNRSPFRRRRLQRRAGSDPSPPPPYESLAEAGAARAQAMARPTSYIAGAGAMSSAIAREQTAANINWRIARHGVRLLEAAIHEADEPPLPNPDATTPSSTALERQLYHDALSYLLRGLPSTPTPDLTAELTAALPAYLRVPVPTPPASAPQRLTRALVLAACAALLAVSPQALLVLRAVAAVDGRARALLPELRGPVVLVYAWVVGVLCGWWRVGGDGGAAAGGGGAGAVLERWVVWLAVGVVLGFREGLEEAIERRERDRRW